MSRLPRTQDGKIKRSKLFGGQHHTITNYGYNNSRLSTICVAHCGPTRSVVGRMAGALAGHRRPSAPWNRLKSIPVDPLEDVGLVSKGDNRHANRESIAKGTG